MFIWGGISSVIWSEVSFWRVAVKRNFRPYNRGYTSPNEHFEYDYPHSNALFNIYSLKVQHFAQNWSFVSNVKQLRQPITSDVTYDVGAATVMGNFYLQYQYTLPVFSVKALSLK